MGDFVERYARRRSDTERPPLRATLRWHGARIVHVGVLMTFVGIAGSGGFDVEKQAALKPGERIQVGKFELVYTTISRPSTVRTLPR